MLWRELLTGHYVWDGIMTMVDIGVTEGTIESDFEIVLPNKGGITIWSFLRQVRVT